jgi:hypothetical protein
MTPPARCGRVNFIGREWGGGPPRLSPELVAAYTRYVADNGAVVTWDVPVGRDGRIAEEFMAHLTAIGKAMVRRGEQ